MHTTLALSALLATSVLASNQHAHLHVKKPYQLKKERAVLDVYKTAIQYVYETVYVGGSSSSETSAAAAPSSSSAAAIQRYVGDGGRHWSLLNFGADSTSSEDPVVVLSSSILDFSVALSSIDPETTTAAAATTTIAVVPAPTSSAARIALTSSAAAVASISSTAAVASSPSAAVVASTTSAAADASATIATTYEEIAIAHHNVHRRNHSSVDIVWSAEMAAIALAEASVCIYAHNVTGGGGGYGQNIAAGVPAANISEIITGLFYNGEVNWFDGLYGEANPDFTNFENWGHFSQIVWNDTTSVGCATVDCSASGLAGVGSDVSPLFTVCNYSPPGNMGGEYGANIFEPLDEATVGWNYAL